MTINELRIGNWIKPVNYEHQETSLSELPWGTVNVISKDGIAFSNYGFTTLNDVVPIALSEQWFNTFGIYLGQDNFNLTIDEDKDAPGRYVLSIDRFVISRFRYVHEFQNLYFAITGEELQFAEPENYNNEN